MCIDTIQYSTLHQATTHYFINNDGWNNGCDKNRRTVASVSRSYCPCTRIIGYCVVLTIIKVLTSIIVCTSITLQCTERVWLCDCVNVLFVFKKWIVFLSHCVCESLFWIMIQYGPPLNAWNENIRVDHIASMEQGFIPRAPRNNTA